MRDDVAVDLDYARLAAALIAERKARKWNQVDLARAADIGEMTVQRAENPNSASRPTRRTLKAIDLAFGWRLGSCEAILRGGEPTLTSASSGASVAPGLPAPKGDNTSTTSSRPLPAGFQAVIDDGETVALDVIEFDDMHLVVVVKAGSYRTDEGRENLKEAMREWLRVQQGIRDLTPKPDET